MKSANANLTLVEVNKEPGLATPAGFHENTNLQSLVSPVSVPRSFAPITGKDQAPDDPQGSP